MNAFIAKIRPGEDVILHIFLRNNETGEAEDFTSSTITLSVVLTNGNHEIIVPSDAILRNAGLVKNEFLVRLTSEITSSMKAGMYHAKVTANFPSTVFPDNTRTVKYLDENVCQVIG